MKMIKNPKMNAAVILIITVFYSWVFILISGHIEFERMLRHAAPLNLDFWNAWSIFLIQGNMKYIGYVYIVWAVVIVFFSFIRKRDYDEYQTGIFLSLLQNQMLQTVIWMGCLNRKKWRLIHITMLINFHRQAVSSGTACSCILWKNLYIGTFPPSVVS